MCTAEIRLLANKVLNKKHLGIDAAMDYVLGACNEKNQDLHAAVFNEVQDILNPHGKGEDAVYCEH